MPIHLPPINRRGFLADTLAIGAGLLLPCEILAKEPTTDPNFWVLMADTHVSKDREKTLRGATPAKNLRQAVEEILSFPSRPTRMIVAGDCAFLHGESGDYATLGELIKPLRQAGLPMHFALGNHDNRERFLAAFPEAKSRAVVDPGELGKFVTVLETPHANWFLLDSLDKTDVSDGLMGESQLAWLAKALDARPEKPALLLAHHDSKRKRRDMNPSLRDTKALFDIILPRKQVKAYFFGHLHYWHIDRQEDLHLVTLPTTAWLLDKTQPQGFVTTQLRSDGITLVLHSLDRKHAKHLEKIELKWRT